MKRASPLAIKSLYGLPAGGLAPVVWMTMIAS